VSWPAEWAAKVPAPKGCTLGPNAIMALGAANAMTISIVDRG
jgi:hypothetical protein